MQGETPEETVPKHIYSYLHNQHISHCVTDRREIIGW